VECHTIDKLIHTETVYLQTVLLADGKLAGFACWLVTLQKIEYVLFSVIKSAELSLVNSMISHQSHQLAARKILVFHGHQKHQLSMMR